MSEYQSLIRGYLSSRPGSHLRMIQRELGIALGTLRYHLVRMERSGDISSYSLGRLKGYFVAGEVDHALKPYLMALRNERPRQVVALLVEAGKATHREIAEELRLSPSSLSLYLRMLTRGGVLTRLKSEGKAYYALHDPVLASEGLRRVRRSLTDRLVDASLHVYEERGK